MKKIILFLLMFFIPFGVRADTEFLDRAEDTNTRLEIYMLTLDSTCRRGTQEECSQQLQNYSTMGNEVQNILEEARTFGLSDDPIIQKLQANMDVYISSLKDGFGDNPYFSLSTGCGGIYEDGFGDWINNVFTFVKYVGLALVVVLTTMDFLNVIVGSKEDQMNKAFDCFVKRAIAVALLFLTPVLINFVFDMLNDGLNGNTPVIDICIDYID